MYLLASIAFLAWGIWCFVAVLLKKKVQVQLFYSEEFLPKKLLGKYYDVTMNIVYGTLAVAFGVIGVLHYFKKL